MSFRLGVDLDGTLADLSSTFRQFEQNLFGDRDESETVDLDAEDELPSSTEKSRQARSRSEKHDAVWRAIKETPDFWTMLKPLERTAVADLYAASQAMKWEVFFITQRPRTAGATVQAQTQQWLIDQGFPVPSVLTLIGSRGKAAHALDLDFLIDDLPRNCIDVVSDSRCRPILVRRTPDPAAETSVRRMNIGVVRSIGQAITLLSQPEPAPRQTAVSRVLQMLRLPH